MIKLTMVRELEQYQGIPENPQSARAEIPARRDYVLKTIGRSKSGSFDVTRRFFQTALREGTHQAQTPGRVERNLEIVRQYIETRNTLKEIGNRHGITREAVRQMIRRKLVTLWLNCSDKTQRLFPPEHIHLCKPRSVAGGGRSFTVARMLADGKTITEIQEKIGGKGVNYARQRLRNQGIEVPYLRPVKSYQELASRLTRSNLSDIEIQELLSQVTRGLFEVDRRRGYPFLTPVGRIISGCGFHYRRRETWRFIKPLRTAGIPIGEVSHLVESKAKEVTQRYYFIAARHTERARQALEDDPNLEKYRHSPIKQICGSQGELPTTGQLTKKRGVYIPTGQIFAELGIRVAGNAHIKQRAVFTGECPVPVFIYPAASQFFCRREDKETLKEFIRNSLGL